MSHWKVSYKYDCETFNRNWMVRKVSYIYDFERRRNIFHKQSVLYHGPSSVWPQKAVIETVQVMRTSKLTICKRPFWGSHHMNCLCHSIFCPFWNPIFAQPLWRLEKTEKKTKFLTPSFCLRIFIIFLTLKRSKCSKKKNFYHYLGNDVGSKSLNSMFLQVDTNQSFPRIEISLNR